MRAWLLPLLLLAIGPASAQQGRGTALPETVVTAPPRPQAEEPSAELPLYTDPRSLGMPARRAAFNTAWAFGLASRMAGQPALAAQALMEMEFLSVEVVWHPTHYEVAGDVKEDFVGARREWRGAIGIPEAVPTQAAIDTLFRAMQALLERPEPGGLAALPREVLSLGPEETFARLNALPYLPLTNLVAANAARAMRGRRRG